MKKTMLLLSILLIAISSAAKTKTPTTVAFVDVNVVPMDKERVLPHQTVMVRNGAIVEIGDVIVHHDMTRPVEANACVRLHYRRKVLSLDVLELLPELTVPSDQVFRIVSTEDDVIGDVEIARS